MHSCVGGGLQGRKGQQLSQELCPVWISTTTRAGCTVREENTEGLG